MKYRYRLFGIEFPHVRVLLVSADFSGLSSAEVFAKENQLPSAYAPLEQRLFGRLFYRMNPKVVVPLDDESRSFFERYVFATKGQLKYAVFRNRYFVLVPSINRNVMPIVKRFSSSQKYFVSRMLIQ